MMEGSCRAVLVVMLLAVSVASAPAMAQQPGRFDILLQNAGIASMHTALTHTNTLVFLDRTNIGPSQINLTDGRCRDNPEDLVSTHDCSAHSVIFDIATNTVRPVFIYTDTWCSSGAFLPNGTLMQTGGDNEGFKKVRYYSPCAPGGDCDWVESAKEMLAGRWYATNQLLPDGRILTLGGRNVFTYEFVPDQGLGQFYLQFLNDTNDEYNDNYYPFVHLLPDNNLYIFANRDSILLNYFSNTVLRKYPTIPGEPRNYPCAGSSVLLPLDNSNDFSVAEVLICGGSNKFAFPYPPAQLGASQTCGRMTVTADNPSWEMLTMPVRRNMGDMVLLPTGDVLIVNGAQNGSQGWGSASNAAFNPLIFTPSTSQFELQVASTIARVYHSTANLLPDGRILIAGSNTHQFYTFTGAFPTELRVEAFSPAYLDSSNDFQRPTFVNVPTVLRYGDNFTADISLSGNLTSAIQLILCSVPFTTHSYSQGQRQLKLPVSQPLLVNSNTYSVSSSAPKKAVLAPSGYYMLFPVHNGIPGRSTWVLVTF